MKRNVSIIEKNKRGRVAKSYKHPSKEYSKKEKNKDYIK